MSTVKGAMGLLADQLKQLAAAQATIAEMREALEAFCEYAEACNDDSPEFYRARATIAIQCNQDAMKEEGK